MSLMGKSHIESPSQISNLQCVQKKRDQNVFVISSTKLGRFWWNLVHRFLNKFAAKMLNTFHLTWIMSLHYLVILEIFITQMLPLHCQRKELQNLSHLNCGLQIRQIWSQLITACWEYCKRRCTKHASLSWMNWNSDWEERRGPLRQSFVSGVSIAADHWSVFCTPLLQYFPHSVINWIQIWRICRP